MTDDPTADTPGAQDRSRPQTGQPHLWASDSAAPPEPTGSAPHPAAPHEPTGSTPPPGTPAADDGCDDQAAARLADEAARLRSTDTTARPLHRTRNRAAGGAGLLAAVIAALLLIPGARDRLPAGVPVVGRDASTVYAQLRRAGLPVTEGEPSSAEFRDMVHDNQCKSSRSFVRTDTDDTGWGFICVEPPRQAYRHISDAFESVPMLAGPLYVDDGGGDVLVFGFGWPADASKTIYDAIDGSGGSYLVAEDAAG